MLVECVICKAGFSGTQRMEDHLQTHHLPWDCTTHACATCKLGFCSLKNLTEHNRHRHRGKFRFRHLPAGALQSRREKAQARFPTIPKRLLNPGAHVTWLEDRRATPAEVRRPLAAPAAPRQRETRRQLKNKPRRRITFPDAQDHPALQEEPGTTAHADFTGEAARQEEGHPSPDALACSPGIRLESPPEPAATSIATATQTTTTVATQTVATQTYPGHQPGDHLLPVWKQVAYVVGTNLRDEFSRQVAALAGVWDEKYAVLQAELTDVRGRLDAALAQHPDAMEP